MGPGTVVGGKYRLISLIGEGAMGAVWSAKNELTQRTFALKLLSAQHVGGVEARKRLMREASASGQLTHRNVVEVYDVGVTDAGDPFLVMQLLKGEPLDVHLERVGRLELSKVLEIAVSVARALEVAHAAGIVHRDLKPGNIYLHQDPDLGTVVKVLDFGVSKVLSSDTSSTMTGTAIGSPAYMSPEQAKGEKTLDHRTDLWALGVVMFELLSGVRPFRGETPYAVVADILTGKIPSLSDVMSNPNSGMVDLVARCLERDVKKRVSSAKDVLTALESLGARPGTDSLVGETKVPNPLTAAPASPPALVAPATRAAAATPAAPTATDVPTVPEKLVAAGLAPKPAAPPVEVTAPAASDQIAVAAVTAIGPKPGRDPTQTSTSALVRSSRGSFAVGSPILERLGSLKATLTDAISRLSPRTRIQIATAAGVSLLLVVVGTALTGRSQDVGSESSPVVAASAGSAPVSLSATAAPAPSPSSAPTVVPEKTAVSVSDLPLEHAMDDKPEKKPGKQTTAPPTRKDTSTPKAPARQPTSSGTSKKAPRDIPTNPW